MATIPVATAAISGSNLTNTSATAGPDTLAPGSSDIILIVNNGSAGTVSVTVIVPGNTEWGQAEPDVPTATPIPAGAHAAYRLPARIADPVTGLIGVTAAPNASVTFFAVRAS